MGGRRRFARLTTRPRSYVLRGAPGSDGSFDALRLDLNSGARSSARIAVGPATDFRAFDEAEHAGSDGIELHGLLLRRPTPVLFRIPVGVAAFAWPDAGSWRLYVFALKPAQDRARAPA